MAILNQIRSLIDAFPGFVAFVQFLGFVIPLSVIVTFFQYSVHLMIYRLHYPRKIWIWIPNQKSYLGRHKEVHWKNNDPPRKKEPKKATYLW